MPSTDAINEIKTRLGIVEVVQGRVALQRSGRNFKGLCPLHGEKTPSFVVFPETASYHCFGCGANGDIFAFVMNTEGLAFPDALARLARQAGVDLVPRDAGEAAAERHRERLFEAVAAAGLFFHNLLVRSSAEGARAARNYAIDRGLTEATIERFGLGYAPDSWDATATYLRERGFGNAELLAAGLIIEREGEHAGYYDRFRHRLMFPIRDVRGRTNGFGARALDDRPPKYLNSPQTPIYDKSATLYGIDQATAAIKVARTAILVEGYVDVLIAHQTGHANVVGAAGTALTDRQADILKKTARSIVLALDADAAGDLAALKGSAVLEENLERIRVPILGPRGLLGVERRLDAEIRIMALPRGQDPDELLLRDPAAWDRLLAAAQPVADHFIGVVAAGLDLRTAHGKSEVVRQVAPLVRAIGDPVQRAHYTQKVATLTQSPLAVIERAVAQAPSGNPALPRGRATPGKNRNQHEAHIGGSAMFNWPDLLPEDHLVSVILRYPQASLLPESLPLPHFTHSANRAIMETITQYMLQLSSVAELDKDKLHELIDSSLHFHLDSLLSYAEKQPYLYPFALSKEIESLIMKLNAYNDRLWTHQYELLLAEAQANEGYTSKEDLKEKASTLDQMRPQLMQHLPLPSKVYRDSRDRESGTRSS